jgi:hypothetical protein
VVIWDNTSDAESHQCLPHTELEIGAIGALGGQGVEWKRGREVAGASLFGSTAPHPSDVDQGKLGSCYLLSSLSVLAGVPDYLKEKLFLPNASGEKGA